PGASATPPMARPAGTLTVRAILVTCAAALVSVLVTALIAVPVTINTANRQARDGLAGKARLVADLLGPRLATARPGDEERAAARLRDENIDVFLIRGGAADVPGLPPRFARRVAAGLPVHDRGLVN